MKPNLFIRQITICGFAILLFSACQKNDVEFSKEGETPKVQISEDRIFAGDSIPSVSLRLYLYYSDISPESDNPPLKLFYHENILMLFFITN